ncbi:MAG: amidase family protein, partial [Oceanicaulis sp.]
SDHFRRLLEWGAGQPADKAKAAYEAVRRTEADAERWFAGCDLVVAPTTLEPAFDFSEDPAPGQADLTAFAALSGVAATAVPMGRAANGRPVSIQFMAPAGGDYQAIKAAAQFEIMNGGPFIPPGY